MSLFHMCGMAEALSPVLVQTMGDAKNMEYMRSRRTLEINPEHPIIQGLNSQLSSGASNAQVPLSAFAKVLTLHRGFFNALHVCQTKAGLTATLHAVVECICTANICLGALSEGLLRALAQKFGPDSNFTGFLHSYSNSPSTSRRCRQVQNPDAGPFCWAELSQCLIANDAHVEDQGLHGCMGALCH